jgi:hypothetical protein
LKYAVEMGSGTIIYIPIYYKDRFRHSEIDGGGEDSQTLLLFFSQNKESGLKINSYTIPSGLMQCLEVQGGHTYGYHSALSR